MFDSGRSLKHSSCECWLLPEDSEVATVPRGAGQEMGESSREPHLQASNSLKPVFLWGETAGDNYMTHVVSYDLSPVEPRTGLSVRSPHPRMPSPS
ncbi:hypothetical protein JZ751_008988 [Albula glossodonta]|uniref:Uncharacterized protein n=1 Tax=Albula glossodonta TaxID=121402 RepID=A0A8T2P893_9TELE|nr:hypothetical protein JZ751_008988 [Albula glossodonta]